MSSKSKLAGALNLLPVSALESEKTIICVWANNGKETTKKVSAGKGTGCPNFQLLRRTI